MTTLLVASGGGHLKQLHRLLPRLDISGDRIWVTFDTGLARTLLAGEDVRYAPYAHPHDLRGTANDSMFALKLLRQTRIERAISTGANLAVAFLPVARFAGVRCQYIESATRSEGLSLTGRLLQRIPGIALYTQHPRNVRGRWNYGGNVFEGFVARHVAEPPDVRKMVVTLGSNDSYSFERLVSRLEQIIPGDVDVLWQLGSTSSAVPGAHESVPADQLQNAIADADVVVAHAGTGSALTAMEVGKFPILVTRRSAFDEHVDDHQEMTARYLSGHGLAMAAEADDLNWDDIVSSAAWTIDQNQTVEPFDFAGQRRD